MKLTPITSMLELQSDLNTRIDPFWAGRGRPWWRAAWLEAAELVESTPWKWWKSGEVNLENVKTEIIDILHFALSQALEERGSIDVAACVLFEAYRSNHYCNSQPHIDEAFILRQAERLASICLLDRKISYVALFELAAGAGLSGDELYRRYIAKNVLNLFRQDNGYKEGHYIKQWGAGEDNDYVAGFLASRPAATPAELRAALERAYIDFSRAAALASAQ